jgi:hypothetical protein
VRVASKIGVGRIPDVDSEANGCERSGNLARRVSITFSKVTKGPDGVPKMVREMLEADDAGVARP